MLVGGAHQLLCLRGWLGPIQLARQLLNGCHGDECMNNRLEVGSKGLWMIENFPSL